MTQIMQNCSDPKLAQVIESQWYRYLANYAITENIELIEHKDMIILETSYPLALLNGIFYANFPSEQAEKKVEETIKYFKDH